MRENLHEVISNPENYHNVLDDFERRLNIFFELFELTYIGMEDIEETGIGVLKTVIEMTPRDFKHNPRMKVTPCQFAFGRSLSWHKLKPEVFESILKESRWIEHFTGSISTVYHFLPEKVNAYRREPVSV